MLNRFGSCSLPAWLLPTRASALRCHHLMIVRSNFAMKVQLLTLTNWEPHHKTISDKSDVYPIASTTLFDWNLKSSLIRVIAVVLFDCCLSQLKWRLRNLSPSGRCIFCLINCAVIISAKYRLSRRYLWEALSLPLSPYWALVLPIRSNDCGFDGKHWRLIYTRFHMMFLVRIGFFLLIAILLCSTEFFYI